MDFGGWRLGGGRLPLGCWRLQADFKLKVGSSKGVGHWRREAGGRKCRGKKNQDLPCKSSLFGPKLQFLCRKLHFPRPLLSFVDFLGGPFFETYGLILTFLMVEETPGGWRLTSGFWRLAALEGEGCHLDVGDFRMTSS